MNDILSQQAAEKVLLQGGGEKRSLADIQAEQEFQEWWDAESARIQDEEQKAKSDERQVNEKKDGKSRRRRGGEKSIGTRERKKEGKEEKRKDVKVRVGREKGKEQTQVRREVPK